MKLTISIPTYNRATHLKRRIEELLPQLTDEVEVLIFDNASTDDTGAIVAQFNSARIRYTRNDYNYGSFNFVKCLEHARGEWVWMLGDDDPVQTDAVATILLTIQATSAEWIIFNNLCFGTVQAQDGTIEDVRTLLQRVPLSALTFISGFVARSSILQAELGMYAYFLFTHSSQVVVCLRGVERGAFAVQVCSKPLLQWIPPAVGWSPFQYIRGACIIPQCLDRPDNRKRVAETVFTQVFGWGFAAHLEKIQTREDFLLWRAAYRQSYANLAVYAPGLFWRTFRITTPLQRTLRRVITACLVATLARAPFWTFRPLLRIHRLVEHLARMRRNVPIGAGHDRLF